MHRFRGTIEVGGESHTISNENLVLRGSSMRITDFCYGVIVYAGEEVGVILVIPLHRYQIT